MAIPVSVGDNIRITLKGFTVHGESHINVFHYNFYAGSGTDVGSHLLENFAFGFWEHIKAALRAVTVNSAGFNEVEAVSLDADFNGVNGESFIVPTAERAGLDGGSAAPAFVALTYRYVRPSFAFRHGFKRFGNVSENQLAAGGFDPTLAGNREQLRLRLTEDIGGLYPDLSPLVDPPDARPIVYRRVVNGTVISPVIWGIPVGVTGPKLGSQVTRKQGRGS
jgi:hypothetical protein